MPDPIYYRGSGWRVPDPSYYRGQGGGCLIPAITESLKARRVVPEPCPYGLGEQQEEEEGQEEKVEPAAQCANERQFDKCWVKIVSSLL